MTGSILDQRSEHIELSGCLNIKMTSYQYRDSLQKDETVSQPSCLYDGNTHAWQNGLILEWQPTLNDYDTLEVRNNVLE